MDDIIDFGRVIMVVSGALSLAIVVRVAAARIGLPTAALLLTAAAVAAQVSGRLASLLSFEDVQRVATLALIAILFDGGMSIGLRRFRTAAVPITILGVLGTFGTAPLVAVAAHYVLGFDWTVALLIGAALAPTDPAVTFSVLAGKEVEGRSGTILEGESGFNDPVGIALMIGMIELANVPEAGLAGVAWKFLREMGLGLAVGAVAGFILLQSLRRVPLPDASLYPLAVLLSAGVVYGVATVSHGSGFLAVFVAGIVIGDAEFPRRLEVRHFHSALADLGELAVFVALGLTIDLGYVLSGALWWQGLVLAALLGFVVRPLVVTPLLLPSRLSHGERLFVTWAGLKGAVPILLASLAVVAGTEQAPEIYGIVFVVVLFSVVVQGTLVPAVARRVGVPMVDVDPVGRGACLRPPGCGRRRDDSRRTECCRSRSAVAVEAAAALAAQQACVPHRDEPWRRRHARLTQPFVERLRRVDVHVDAHEVDERAGAHRPAGAVLHRRVESLRCDACLVEDAQAVVQKRNQDTVDDEAGRVVAANDLLAEAGAHDRRRLHRVLRGELRLDDLDERHQRRRIEEVHADDALGPGRGGRDLGHRERRCVGRKNRVGAAEPIEVCEEGTLGLELLHDRLDDEIAVRERLEVRRDREASGRRVPFSLFELALLDLAGEEMADPVCRRVAELDGHLAPDRVVAGLDRELRYPGSHGAEADHADRADLRHVADASCGGLVLSL